MPIKPLLAAVALAVLATPAGAAEPPINTPNRAHNMLAAANPPDQAKALGSIVGCRANGVAFRGYDRSSNASLWRVDCSGGGGSSIVRVAGDAQGSTKVLSCPELKAATGVDCFR